MSVKHENAAEDREKSAAGRRNTEQAGQSKVTVLPPWPQIGSPWDLLAPWTLGLETDATG